MSTTMKYPLGSIFYVAQQPVVPYLNSVVHGDCVQLMADLPNDSVDFILTDPPYLARYRGRENKKRVARLRQQKGLPS